MHLLLYADLLSLPGFDMAAHTPADCGPPSLTVTGDLSNQARRLFDEVLPWRRRLWAWPQTTGGSGLRYCKYRIYCQFLLLPRELGVFRVTPGGISLFGHRFL